MNVQEIAAPASWRCVEFISDIHLQESERANFLVWCDTLDQSPADAIFILGDLFEVWVGDDVLACASESSFEAQCCQVLRACAQKRPVYFMHGNRDFLIGSGFAQDTGVQIIHDPSVLSFAGQRYLLSHGDALCLGDVDYQTFRKEVRSAQWQTEFLATPLQARLQQARKIREASEARKIDLQTAGQPWIDVDATAVQQWMHAAQAQHFIHGHTHEGTDHPMLSVQDQTQTQTQSLGVRHVLPDWHIDGQPPRGYVLRLSRAVADVESEPSGLAGAVARHIPLV